MAFALSPAVQIERDPSGNVRSLNHGGQPYGPIPNVLNAQKLAETYLNDVAEIYGIDSAWLNALGLRPSGTVENAGTELRFAQQDAVTGTATASFQQTHFGLPVWQAGFTVSMLTEPLRATASLSTLHPAIQVDKPKRGARCLGRITPQELAKLLNAERGKEQIVINTERLWIYRYDAAKRVPPSQPGRGGTQFRAEESPTLPLPPPDPSIVDGRHYVVKEVIFGLPSPPRFPSLQWRALIEVNTRSVLYYRALAEAWTGNVYLKDPITATGDTTITACSPASVLDPWPPCDCTHAGGCTPGWYLGAVPEPDNKHWYPEKFRFCVAATTRLGLYAPRRGRRN
jgi:zinc metalloprotease ZmpB